MDQEIKKQKYQYLYSQLQQLKSKIDTLDNIDTELRKELNDGLLINNQIIGLEELSNIVEEKEQILEELSNTVIPIVTRNL